MKMTRDEFDISLAVLSNPEFHYRSCCFDDSGRPTELDCHCPLKDALKKVIHAEILKEV
jgi:hypothetical protein